MLPWVHLDRAAIPGGGELKLSRRGDEFSIRLGDNELMNSLLFGSEEALATLSHAKIADRKRPKILIGGLGMGFTLFKMSMFKKVENPWFKTLQEYQYGKGGSAATQDLFFFSKAGREGFRFASDNRVKVGHLDSNTGEIW
jgi:hypothetical protein